MNLEHYRKARRYASALDRDLYEDILHESFVVWWDKFETDLFEEHIGTIFRTIKYTFLAYLKGNVWFWRGNNQGQRKFERFEDIFNSSSDSAEDRRIEPRLFNSNTPEDEYIATELLGEYMQLISSTHKDRAVFTGNENTTKDILTKRLNGYTNSEIAEELEISRASITYYLNRTKLSEFENRHSNKMINNPFNGSKTKIKKRLTEHQWNEREDREEYEVEVEHEWAILYTHKENGEGFLVRKKNPVQSEDYLKSFVDKEKKVTLLKFKE